MVFRVAARIDVNQPLIVKQCCHLGYTELILSQLKKCFDILVGSRGKNYAFEIKDPDKVPSKRKLTEGEQEFFDTWKGQVDKVETIGDIIKIIES